MGEDYYREQMRTILQIQRQEGCNYNEAVRIQKAVDLSRKVQPLVRRKDMEETITLNDGDGLRILEETTEFSFQCCDCGLIHDVEIVREDSAIVLRFKRR